VFALKLLLSLLLPFDQLFYLSMDGNVNTPPPTMALAKGTIYYTTAIPVGIRSREGLQLAGQALYLIIAYAVMPVKWHSTPPSPIPASWHICTSRTYNTGGTSGHHTGASMVIHVKEK
jgi:hypothetical protein